MRPLSINILGKNYSVTYCDKSSDVDINGHTALWGQIDYWTNSIRVYSGRLDDEVFQTILHEVIHAIVKDLHINSISSAKDEEDIIDLLSLGLADTLSRNEWMK